jgi:uncharacterized protein (TIGR02452 family)
MQHFKWFKGSRPRQQTKRQFFAQIARENRRLFETLINTDHRVQETYNLARQYPETTPLPPVEKTEVEAAKPALVKVVSQDTFDCAEKLTREGVENIACLNMANSIHPGGGYLTGASAQEEALCRRSTLYLTIRPSRRLHPIPAHGGIYSPDVLVLRTSDDNRCTLLPEDKRWWTSVISVAGIAGPKLTSDLMDYAMEDERESTRERIKTILRIAAMEKRKNLVLGALGAGAFGNPPRAVARLFKEVFEQEEFKGRFEGIWFAIIERGGSENHDVFKEVLDGMEI